MSRTLAQRHSHEGIVKPGELIEIRQTAALTLQDRRILNLLIENAGPGITEDEDHHIALRRLRSPGDHASERVKDSILRLMGTIVEVPVLDRNGNRATRRMTLLASTTTTDDESSPSGEVAYSFSKEMREVISKSRYWGRIKAYVMFAFTSKYALALYEALCLRINMRRAEEVLSVADFRQLLAVEDGKLEAYSDLLRRAVQPAIEEINGLSDFNVEIEPIREGGQLRGKLTGFRISWERKEPDEWRDVLDELLRAKIGRKARIRGLVETIT